LILDTNALSAFVDGSPAAVAGVARSSILAIPVIVIGEYRFGIAQSRSKTILEKILAGLMDASLVLPIDTETAERYAEIRLALRVAGKPIPANDLWIAALARQHAMPVMSRDGHFDRVPGLERRGW